MLEFLSRKHWNQRFGDSRYGPISRVHCCGLVKLLRRPWYVHAKRFGSPASIRALEKHLRASVCGGRTCYALHPDKVGKRNLRTSERDARPGFVHCERWEHG